jgi:UDP-N-acetyl-D-galactosamine dehydrogenase
MGTPVKERTRHRSNGTNRRNTFEKDLKQVSPGQPLDENFCEKGIRPCVIGLGFVGLSLALLISKKMRTIGFDISKQRVDELVTGYDRNMDIERKELLGNSLLTFSSDIRNAGECNVYIVTVPTPVDKNNCPDTGPLEEASELIASVLKKGDTVIYESTVYPGCTEEVCIPILERTSGMKYNSDFFCGYSPERMNPGDKKHGIPCVIKLTSGSNEETGRFIDTFFRKVIPSGTFMTSDIKTAEAAKVMENMQRDVNIAFMNEMAVVFSSMGISMEKVLQASRTRWNFLNFTPGLVGGHCVAVDPYWLLWRAGQNNIHMPVTEASRRMNESVAEYLAEKIVVLMARKKINPIGASVLIFGFTFKENCSDCRNTKVADIVKKLSLFGCRCMVYDPNADRDAVSREYGIDMLPLLENKEQARVDVVVGAVSHNCFRDMNPGRFLRSGGFVFDIKGVFPGYLSERP